ncbi:hypothetical protein E1A91_D09G097100v1 [Gossypium mustelinum]|uniref:Oxidative stress 3 n=1 Tax=Gossypium mustelinum TaxID=34275 RepID=A0A5D2TGN0_GOSMU|nr:hypothetical protein E1A91_D09G097100v1 [Gossypium mustelinum]TYI64561.1 hypothetical protein E1A91_D09G097100v1 [Gossypium mustelinum]
MGEEADMNNGMFASTPDFVEKKDQWMNMKDHDDHIIIYDDDDDDGVTSSPSSSFIGDEYSRTCSSSSSLDMADDASSSSSTIDGPLFHLSELMAQLPIKRGLSKYFQGKSQTFTSLSNVNTIEELAKKETPFYRKKLKACKSHKLCTPPRATIGKKLWRNHGLSSSCPGRKVRSSFLGGRPPLIPIPKKF